MECVVFRPLSVVFEHLGGVEISFVYIFIFRFILFSTLIFLSFGIIVVNLS